MSTTKTGLGSTSANVTILGNLTGIGAFIQQLLVTDGGRALTAEHAVVAVAGLVVAAVTNAVKLFHDKGIHIATAGAEIQSLVLDFQENKPELEKAYAAVQAFARNIPDVGAINTHINGIANGFDQDIQTLEQRMDLFEQAAKLFGINLSGVDADAKPTEPTEQGLQTLVSGNDAPVE